MLTKLQAHTLHQLTAVYAEHLARMSGAVGVNMVSTGSVPEDVLQNLEDQTKMSAMELQEYLASVTE